MKTLVGTEYSGMRILVCGDRNFKDILRIKRFLSQYPPSTVVIEGEARGADKLARSAAGQLGLFVEQYPALWSQYGRAAGPIRNQQMLKEGKPDLVVWFHDDIENSKGTKNMIKIARKAGIEVVKG